MTSPHAAARPERVQAVLRAATAVLVDHGYAALTVDRIAMEAHASKATIYKSWPTKTDLVCAVAANTPTVPIPCSLPALGLVDTLLGIAEAVRSVTTGMDGRLLLALHEASRAEPRIAEAVDRHLVVPQQAAITLALNALQDQARIAAHVDTGLAARVVASLVIDRALASGETVTDEELHKIVLQWLVPVLSPQVVDGRTLGPTADPG
jgi:AcrR family transcriptional regulator